MIVLKTGTDLIEIERFMNYRRDHPSLWKRFVERVFTTKELEECQERLESLAGKFAAKEAVAKAMGCGIGPISWQEIEILRGLNHEPVLYLHGQAVLMAAELGLTTWALSISHTRTNALAMVTAVGEASLAPKPDQQDAS